MSLSLLLSRTKVYSNTSRTLRLLRGKHTANNKDSNNNNGAQTIFNALPGRAVRMLKFMSLTGSTAACTATVAAGVSQSQGNLTETDLNVVSLAFASIVSIASTIAVTRLFGPFVTRITLLPPTASKQPVVQMDHKHGLPKFDSLLAKSKGKKGMFRLTQDSEIVLHSPGVLGLNTVDTRVRIGDLVPSPRKFRTWDIRPSVVETRKTQGIKTPVTTFTIMWKSVQNSPTKGIMQEINTLVGAA
ncbi:hypothetical protein H4R99_007048 [Coemansia sp. RSA 1722]|nr:hypothetical protein IWW45_006678 [Coemansia sp. RSA 485]KAJ2590589.1 hypothetical protein H4R99_007048 [Coemansia sp. RSA 1722]